MPHGLIAVPDEVAVLGLRRAECPAGLLCCLQHPVRGADDIADADARAQAPEGSHQPGINVGLGKLQPVRVFPACRRGVAIPLADSAGLGGGSGKIANSG